MPNDRSDKDSVPDDLAPDQGRSGWAQVVRQDKLSWTVEDDDSRDEPASPPVLDEHGRNANLAPPRDDDGFSEYLIDKQDDTPDTNWELDDYRRTEFAGSRDGTNHPDHPPGIDGQPPIALDPD